MAILSFVWSGFGLLFALVFPAVFLVRVRRQNFLTVLPVLVLVSASILIFECVFFAAVNIPIERTSILISQTILSLAAYAFIKKSSKGVVFDARYSKRDVPYLLAIYGAFAVALATRFLPIYSQVPVLSDPEAHAWYTKLILDTKDITYFYSPGLHILSAFLVQTAHVSIPIAVNGVTQVFNALSVLSWGIAIFIATKSRRLALIASLLALIVPLPAIFYAIAGKNALVVANAFLPFVFVFVSRFVNDFRKSDAVWLAGFLTAIGLVHYPAFSYAAVWAFLAIAAYLLYEWRKRGLNKPHAVTAAAVFLAVLVVVGGWSAYLYKADKTRADNLTAAQSLTLQKLSPAEVNKLAHMKPTEIIQQLNAMPAPASSSGTDSISSTPQPTCDGQILPKALACKLKQVVNSYAYQYENATYTRFPIYAGIMLLAILFLAYATPTKQTASIVLWLLTALLLPFAVSVLGINAAVLIAKTGYLMAFQFFVLAAAFLIFNLLRSVKLRGIHLAVFIIFALLPVFYISKEAADRLDTAKNLVEWVSKNDLSAFAWINANVPDNKGFLNNVVPETSAPEILFPDDGGEWLGLYTNNPAAFIFHSPGFSSTENHINYYFYKMASSSDSQKEQAGIKELNKLGYTYYYDDFETSAGKGALPIGKLMKNKHVQVKLLYSNSGVRVYSIKAT